MSDLVRRLRDKVDMFSFGEHCLSAYDIENIDEAAARIEQLERELAEARGILTVVRDNIPMSYLQKNDVSGATGPTDALDLKQAIRDYAEARWKIIEALKESNTQLAAEKALADWLYEGGAASDTEWLISRDAYRKARGM